MPKNRTRDRVGEDDITAIIAAVERYPSGASRENIAAALPRKLAPRTLQFWLKNLVESGRLTSQGLKRAVKYHLPAAAAAAAVATSSEPAEAAGVVPVSGAGGAIQLYLSKPVEARKPVGYNHKFLDSYRPNVRFYLSEKERERLREMGDAAYRGGSCGNLCQTDSHPSYDRPFMELKPP